MTYEDLLKSSDWVQNISSSYFESLGAKVLIFKLDKTDTRLNPIYNEEIDGRKYLRPFEIKSIYKTDPFNFSFSDTIPSETEGSLDFYFNFKNMARTMEALKASTSVLKIMAKESGWSMWKQNDLIYIFNQSVLRDPISYDIKNTYKTISEFSQALSDSGYFSTKHTGDDYCECIPNFKETKLSNSLLLKTFNSEFKNAGNTIEQGDLIYITTLNALYEVTAAYPVNNTIYRYVNWQCKAQRTFAYVEYEKLKSYGYGFDVVENVDQAETKTDVSIGEDNDLYSVASDEEIQSIINAFNN